MPAIIKVKILEGRDLPVMDRASDLTDAFVELRLCNTFYKTDVCRKSLNPQWDSDWFRFEVDDEELQQEILQIKVLDYDMYSSHDSIGKVSINLDIFATKGGLNEMSGIFPIYDTIHGIRGHLKIKLKVQFFMDNNKYRQTSCGVQLFSASCVPSGFVANQIQGLVEELIVNDDPEYHWIDKIRTPRASNEARQRLFSKLSGEVKRKIGMKVLDAGGNAVIGYKQLFDLEGETGIIVRAIGTAVTLVRDSECITNSNVHFGQDASIQDILPDGLNLPPWRSQRSLEGTITDWRCHSSPGFDGDNNKGVSFSEFTDNPKVLPTLFKNASRKEHEHDHPFFTLTTPPFGFVLNLGGIVSSRAVKLLDKLNNPDDSDTRDCWWNELRIELRSHAKAMGCNAIVGYSEYTSICDDLIVLSVYGTAAVIKSSVLHEDSNNVQDSTLRHAGNNENESDSNNGLSLRKISDDTSSNTSTIPSGGYNTVSSCSICHIPYSETELPLPINFSRCAFCKLEKVPDILFTTIDIPDEMPITGSGCMIQARAIRCRKKDKGETDAENVSQILPFLEFDMHQQLLNKLKLKGMNSIFGLKAKLCIGEQVIVGIMTGTAVFIAALPHPPLLKVSSQNDGVDVECDRKLADIREKLIDINKKNLQFHSIKETLDFDNSCREKLISFSERNNMDTVKNENLDFFTDGKDTFVLEVDDISDANILPLLSNTNDDGFNIFNTQATPGFPMLQHGHQYVSVFNRIKVPVAVDDDLKTTHWLSHICDSLIMRLRLKTRMIRPCCLTKTSFDIDIDNDDNFQLTISAFVTKIDQRYIKPLKFRNYSRSLSSHSETSNDVEDRDNQKQIKCVRTKRNELNESICNVIICPADLIPNTQIISYIGNVSFFLIRESLSVKEDGGLDLFMQQFMCEIHAILRAHVQALGGNAILSFSLNEIILYYNTHKNHASCLINLSGDAACIRGFSDVSGNLICLNERTLSASSSIGSSPITECPIDSVKKIDEITID